MTKKTVKQQKEEADVKNDLKDIQRKLDLIYSKVDISFVKEVFSFLEKHPWARRTIYVIILYYAMGENEWFGELVKSIFNQDS
jgi:hypothetical protein